MSGCRADDPGALAPTSTISYYEIVGTARRVVPALAAGGGAVAGGGGAVAGGGGAVAAMAAAGR